MSLIPDVSYTGDNGRSAAVAYGVNSMYYIHYVLQDTELEKGRYD